ncbi:unnamed protein product [Heterosigma akashiwo]
MGQALASLWAYLVGGVPSKRLLMLGLDNSGKTTILYRLNLGVTIHTVPTIGFNVETIRYRNLEFCVWDVGGQDKIRALWRHYLNDTDALIFCIDSADSTRLGVVYNTLHWLLNEKALKGASLLIFANKQDLPGCMSTEALCQELDLNKMHDRKWHIQNSCALTGDGLWEGLDWLFHACLAQERENKSR